MSEAIPHSRPTLGPAEAAAAQGVIASGQLAQGRQVAALEAEVAALTQRRYAVAVSSGTAALQLSLLALGVGQGQCVAAPSYVCSALLHAIGAVGATPVLCDIDGDSRNLDPADLGRRRETDWRAIIVPHMFGRPAPVPAVGDLGIPVVEDCAMCLATELGGHPVGSFGEVSVCSFYATKVVTTGGEGGMVLTDSGAIAEKVRALRDYDERPVRGVRYNYKMTEIGAAIGRVQVRRLPEFVARRRELSRLFDEQLRGAGLGLPTPVPEHTYYRYVVAAPGRAPQLLAGLEARGVGARRPVYNPLHRELDLADADYPRATEAFGDDVSLPIYPSLSDGEAARIAAAVTDLQGA